MILAEYDPELVYIKSPDNLVADALSRLELLPDEETPIKDMNFLEWLNLEQEELPADSYPLHWALIEREQQSDSRLQRAFTKHKGYHSKVICGGEKEFNIIHYRDKVVIPLSLQKKCCDLVS